MWKECQTLDDRHDSDVIDSYCKRAVNVCASNGGGIEEQDQAASVARHLLSFADDDLSAIRELFTIYDKGM